jgi:glycosyltransferase involved in cell wall biosynthesis
MMQYFPHFARAGIETEVRPFFDDAYLSALYADRRKPLATASYYIQRMRDLLRAKRADAVWLEQELFPWLPSQVERLFMPRQIPVFSDYDDAIFHRYDLHDRAVVRNVLGSKIDRVMAASRLVMAGNSYLASRARASGASRIEIVPTVVDVSAYEVAALPEPDGKPRIGWIGTPSTWSKYMAPLMPMLLAVAEQQDAVLRAVGAGPAAGASPRLEILPWSEESESRLIQGMDVGLMPLDDSPWSRGKCGYKIIQYLACGVPVVASPVGVNSEIIEHGVNGFLASTEAEWREALDVLMNDRHLRRRMGIAGRRTVEERYSLDVWAPRVVALMKEAADAPC